MTGGEPLAQDGCIELLDKLIKNKYTVLLETSGSISISEVPGKVIKIVEKDIDSIFSNAKKKTESGVGVDYDKEAIRHDVYFILNSGDIYLQCMTFGKKAKKKRYIFDNLRLTILTKEFSNWITHEAYK